MKIYGPYIRKDNRKHIIIVGDDGSKRTQSYPRFVMEQHLGRSLLKEETVDHIDNNFNNNSIENLQILSLSENVKKATALKPVQIYEFLCPCCGKSSSKPMNWVKHNWKLGKKGPYCSRKCAGKMHN